MSKSSSSSMDNASLYQNTDYLRSDQYRNSSNLGARSQLHERYASNPVGWFTWVMDYLALQAGDRVLECGGGPGWLWRRNLDRLPSNCQITLTDLSTGMVAEAEESLAETNHDFRFLDVDIMRLPFEDDEFDVVVANSMLYHVADRQNALAEVRRVLREDGRFYAATIGLNHMLELRVLRQKLFPRHAASYQKLGNEFSLENGRAQLAAQFKKIDLYRYENRLLVTETDHLLEYLLSSSEVRKEVDPQLLSETAVSIEKQINRQGFFAVTTDSGLFAARN